MSEESPNKIFQSVYVLAISRLFVNMTRRFYYPFLPAISRELGVSLASVQGAAASQAGVGLFSPFFGAFSERYGRKRVMLAALSLMSMASLVGFLMPNQFSVFYTVMVIWGLSKWLFDPPMQAYIADRVPYDRRGFAIGITEWAWAGALLVGAPVAGILLNSQGLQGIFAFMFICHLIGLGLLWRLLPSDHPSGEAHEFAGFQDSWRVLLSSRIAMSVLIFSVTLYAGNEMVFIVYGDWMESTFDLAIEALATVTIVIPIAEVLGEGFVIGFSDRIGKRRLTLVSTIAAGLAYLALPHLSFSLPAVMGGLFLIFITIEIAIVSSIPMFTEVLPEARAVMMSSNVAAQGSGRLLGAFLGGAIYSQFDSFILTGLGAGLITFVSFAVMWVAIPEAQAAPAPPKVPSVQP